MEPGELLPEPHSRMPRQSLLYSSCGGYHACSSSWVQSSWVLLRRPSPPPIPQLLHSLCSVFWGISWAQGVWYRCPLCVKCCILQKDAFSKWGLFLIYLLECCCLDQLRRALPCDWKHWGIVINFSMLKSIKNRKRSILWRTVLCIIYPVCQICQLIDGICFIMLSIEYLKFIFSSMQLLVLYLCILFSFLRQWKLLCSPH